MRKGKISHEEEQEVSIIEPYCLLTGGRCAHFPIKIVQNSFFIAEPFDKEREEREKAIFQVIKGYPYIIADQKALNIAITCKICRDIQSAQFGIVDITNLNENVLIELGMLYGFKKPTVILVKSGETVINIPSNIVGIEQVRYKDFNELSNKLEKVIGNLFGLWKKKSLFLLDLKAMIDEQISQLEILIATKRLIEKRFQSRILDFKMIGSKLIAVVDKGELHGIVKGMRFEVYRCDQKIDEGFLEEHVGFLLVTHPQERISQTQPIPTDPNNSFWKDSLIRRSHPRNIVRPFLTDENKKISLTAIRANLNALKVLQRYYQSVGGI